MKDFIEIITFSQLDSILGREEQFDDKKSLDFCEDFFLIYYTCLFVCPIHVNKSEPILPKCFGANHITPGKVYGLPKMNIFTRKGIDFLPQTLIF